MENENVQNQDLNNPNSQENPSLKKKKQNSSIL